MKKHLPTIEDLSALIRSIKPDICDEYVDEPDGTPYIDLTIGAHVSKPGWSYQTGDNSFTGGAYGYPHWGVVSVTRDCNAQELARDIQSQLLDAFGY